MIIIDCVYNIIVNKLNVYYDSLDKLYTLSNRLDVDLLICGEQRTLTSFHYANTNEDRPLNVKKHGYIDLKRKGHPHWYLSRYEALGAIVIPSYYDQKLKAVVPRRLLISLTPLIHEKYKDQMVPNFYLLQVLSTLCVEALTHFLVYDSHIEQCSIWTTLEKGYQCDIDYKIDDDFMNMLLEKREHHLRIRGMIYSRVNGYKRDSHKPENAKREKEIYQWTDAQVDEAEAKWTIYLGPDKVEHTIHNKEFELNENVAGTTVIQRRNPKRKAHEIVPDSLITPDKASKNKEKMKTIRKSKPYSTYDSNKY